MGNKKLFGWLDFGSNILGSVANVISTALTNKSNQRIEAARNAMQIAENEKAYQRSKPTNQVANLQAAGMSKAGALNTLNGGGSYTPASISSSTNQAPQIDLSSAFDGLIQIGENAKQRKLQEDSLDKQIAAAEAAQKAQFEENEKQRAHDLEMQSREHSNTNRNADNRLNFDKKVYDDAAPLRQKQLEQLDKTINHLDAQTNNTKVQTALYDLQYELNAENLDVKKLRNLADDLGAISERQLNILFNDKRRIALESLDSEQLNLYMQYKLRMELVSILSVAIKEEEWSKNITNNKLNILSMLENLLIRK